jgi:AGZA family xanthine/uracil permease-like MFS transporter
VALLVGTALAWLTSLWHNPHFGPEPMMSGDRIAAAWSARGWILPTFCGSDIAEVFKGDLIVRFLGITVPLGLLSALGSLQNIESAASAGDRFNTTSCLAVDGLGTIAAALFGSCFPTSIYIGHPGWKALGARAGYSVLNAAFFTLVFLAGLGGIIAALVPIEAGAAIVLWIGIVITAQSYEATPRRHFPAVAIAFFPAIAAWVTIKCELIYTLCGGAEPLAGIVADNAWAFLVGLYALAGSNSGFIVTCTMLSGIAVALIDRHFRAAAAWAAAAALLTVIGLQHAFMLQAAPPVRELLIWQQDIPKGAFAHRGIGIAIGYGLCAALFMLIHVLRGRGRTFEDLPQQGPQEQAPNSVVVSE